MSNAPFIITETPNGRGTPSSVWWADNEADYVNRVRAANIRSDGAQECVTTADAVAYAQESRACSVKIIDQAEFNSMTLDSWDPRVIRYAVTLGWINELAADE